MKESYWGNASEGQWGEGKVEEAGRASKCNAGLTPVKERGKKERKEGREEGRS